MEIEKHNWPEKYDINKLVTIQNDIDKIINETKTSVRRNDRYADPGDSLMLDGHKVVVEHVYPQKLGEITEENAQQEGYKSLEAYKNGITNIHGEDVWDPEQVVWVHELKVVG
ncbi:ASCH domain-containing protein [Lentibacillus cibarius]|uniref:ASCH domain-containing protein n=1 Tax=Lentibacillus cibarius TaxID=2583219 RepID=A0A5S3QNK5_9BACI|nr:ASCH domain-containing protein [Lentibacillus cibarius]TMN23369.1 ASCH domain-containing protein [Lentibacillus cibarius]